MNYESSIFLSSNFHRYTSTNILQSVMIILTSIFYLSVLQPQNKTGDVMTDSTNDNDSLYDNDQE